ncbi:MAG TPA: response regulator [Stellaceae bacterium]|nr:response regulator [Stellaceae bacterium]
MLLFVVAAWQNYAQVDRSVNQELDKAAGMLLEHSLKVFETGALVLGILDQQLDLSRWDEIERSTPVHDLLSNLDKSLDQVDALWLLDATGKVRNSSRFFPTDGLIMRAEDGVVALQSSDAGALISAPSIDKLTGNRRFNISRRHFDRNGVFDGVVVVSASVDYFRQFYETVVFGVRPVVDLLRADGTLLVRYPDLGEAQPAMLGPNSGFRQAIVLQPESGDFHTKSEVDGVERHFRYRRLKNEAVYVVYGIDRNTIIYEWLRNLKVYGLFAMPATLILVLVTWVALRNAQHEQAVTRRLQLEIERREHAEAVLRQTQKIEAVGQLTGGIAHDFNNLLTVITGNLSLLERHLKEEKTERLVRAAQRAAQRGEQLTQQLLAFSRKQHLVPASVDINELINGMCDFLRGTIGSTVEIETEFAPNLWPALVDRNQIEHVVLNLALNARDAMPVVGGCLIFRTQNVFGIDTIGRGSLPPGEFVRIAVIDNGTGMTPQVREQAFEPFFTTKEVGKGSGLGLSQVYGIVTQTGGTVHIDSDVGRGTRIDIYLPRAYPVLSVTPPPAPEEPAVRMPGRARILVVDDDPDILRFVATCLAELDYDVVEATGGAQAIKELGSDQPLDLVLTDLAMPAVTGADLTRWVERNRPDLPVLIMTGFADLQSFKLTVDLPVLAKPFGREELTRRVVITLANAEARRQGLSNVLPLKR